MMSLAMGRGAADVVIDGNISNTRKIAAVIVGGKLIPKASLDKMLKDAEAAAGKS